MRYYRVSTVTGDRYGGEWPREAFQKYGITYRLGIPLGLPPLMAIAALLTRIDVKSV